MSWDFVTRTMYRYRAERISHQNQSFFFFFNCISYTTYIMCDLSRITAADVHPAPRPTASILQCQFRAKVLSIMYLPYLLSLYYKWNYTRWIHTGFVLVDATVPFFFFSFPISTVNGNMYDFDRNIHKIIQRIF